MVSKSIVMRFVGLVVLLIIGLLSNYSQISSPMFEMSIPWCEGVC